MSVNDFFLFIELYLQKIHKIIIFGFINLEVIKVEMQIY